MTDKYILKHIQYSDGSYDIEEVLIANKERLEEIRLHNKIVRKYIYETRKITSRYSIEQIEKMTGRELESDEPSPLEKLLELEMGNFYENRNIKFEDGLAILSDALLTLTQKQREIFNAIVVDGKSRRELARMLGVSHTAVKLVYDAALKKLRKYFLSQSEYFLYFPNLSNKKGE